MPQTPNLASTYAAEVSTDFERRFGSDPLIPVAKAAKTPYATWGEAYRREVPGNSELHVKRIGRRCYFIRAELLARAQRLEAEL